MPSLLFILSLLNFIFIFGLGLYDSYLLLICILPWTIILYAILSFKGISFTNNDPIQQYSGKLYWIGRGSIQATLLACLNIVISALLTSNESLAQFDLQFGTFSSIMIFFLLPMPGFLLFMINGKNQEYLYDLLANELLSTDEEIPFVFLTNELLTKFQRYSNEYFNQLDLVRKSVHEHINGKFPQISSFFDLNQSYHLNLENLALFVTKKTVAPVMGEIKNTP